MAHWLEWKCGLAAATAREHVRVARAIAALPVICAEARTSPAAPGAV
jgi:hypothetical protein